MILHKYNIMCFLLCEFRFNDDGSASNASPKGEEMSTQSGGLCIGLPSPSVLFERVFQLGWPKSTLTRTIYTYAQAFYVPVVKKPLTSLMHRDLANCSTRLIHAQENSWPPSRTMHSLGLGQQLETSCHDTYGRTNRG